MITSDYPFLGLSEFDSSWLNLGVNSDIDCADGSFADIRRSNEQRSKHDITCNPNKKPQFNSHFFVGPKKMFRFLLSQS